MKACFSDGFLKKLLTLSNAESCCFSLSKPGEPAGITTKKQGVQTDQQLSAVVTIAGRMGGASESSRLWQTFESAKRFCLSSERLLQFWLDRTDTHTSDMQMLYYIEDMTLNFIYHNDVLRKVKVKLFWNKRADVLVHPCGLGDLAETVQWILNCAGQPLLQRIAKLEMMLLGVFSLHLSTLISAENIFSPMVSGFWWHPACSVVACVCRKTGTGPRGLASYPPSDPAGHKAGHSPHTPMG